MSFSVRLSQSLCHLITPGGLWVKRAAPFHRHTFHKNVSSITHVKDGGVRMVNVEDNGKLETKRVACASGRVVVNQAIIDLLRRSDSSCKDSSLSASSKGPVLTTAEIAGIMGAKKTSDLIPLCHNINLSQIEIKCRIDEGSNSILVSSVARSTSKTGVEMEALTGVSIAALTLYDMCKAVCKSAVIQEIQLDYKSGGKSGEYIRSNNCERYK
ncbi:cyclic pyranopterin monophosphate synthase-like [Condylostylus longicornis]|uniref:cyclic pyranopterin monophosphate synthase-like n=1 Tax=Condylostylus longicornis TaxID=2530218 RepID=UPI00244E463F|nr:cyclic pyranopterin monophosphate synthase-like [Condylostylus longicornis]